MLKTCIKSTCLNKIWTWNKNYLTKIKVFMLSKNIIAASLKHAIDLSHHSYLKTLQDHKRKKKLPFSKRFETEMLSTFVLTKQVLLCLYKK
jgi:hypothetical protein